MGLFDSLFSEAKKQGALLDGMTVRAKLTDGEENVTLTAKADGTTATSETVEGVAQTFAAAEKARVSKAFVFSRSKGSRAFPVKGTFAADAFRKHELVDE